MANALRRHWLAVSLAVVIALLAVGLLGSVSILIWLGLLLLLGTGAVYRTVYANERLDRASAGTERTETVWRGADAATIKRYKDAGWTLLASEPIKGLGGQIGSQLKFRKDSQ